VDSGRIGKKLLQQQFALALKWNRHKVRAGSHKWQTLFKWTIEPRKRNCPNLTEAPTNRRVVAAISYCDGNKTR